MNSQRLSQPHRSSRTSVPPIAARPRPLRVGFLSTQNYLDRYTFSGTLFSMYHALKRQGIELVHLGNPFVPTRWHRWSERAQRVWHRLSRSQPNSDRATRMMRAHIQRQMDSIPMDVILAPVAGGEVAALKFRVPVVHLSDSTILLTHEHYGWWSGEEFERSHREEQQAIAKASRVTYPSQWAADSAVLDYHVARDRVLVAPFGPNLDPIPSTAEVLAIRRHHDPRQVCRLLFIGREWERKGGAIAVETLHALLDRGIAAELTVVGTEVPDRHSKISVIPHLNKNHPQDHQTLCDLLLRTSFLIVPTRAECFGMVFCEASALGVPSLTTNVGGIPSVVRSGRNGYLFSLGATGEDYANRIVQVIQSPLVYYRLVETSRNEFDRRLNWDTWATAIHGLLQEIVAESQATGEVIGETMGEAMGDRLMA